MKLSPLTVKDKRLFNDFLRLAVHDLSVYAFENIFIWSRLYNILWMVEKDNLCVFFKDKIGCFLYLPPLGRKIEVNVVEKSFEIMDGYNRNRDISRIENVEEKGVGFFERLGYKCRVQSQDYICDREQLVDLKGDKFKSKRACCNYFIKNYKFEILPYSPEYKTGCLSLYKLWQSQRKTKKDDVLYRGMLEDSRLCLEVLLDDYKNLDLSGRIILIKDKVAAFTFGYELNPDTFCVLYEMTDISVKGLAQFIFREFCRQLQGYRHINIMDDSGLENLKRVKFSYCPVRMIPACSAVRR